MSRRHRGRPHHHAPAGADAPRRGPGPDPTRSGSPEAIAPRTAAAAPPRTQAHAPQRAPEPLPERAIEVTADRPTAPPQIAPAAFGPGVTPPSHGSPAITHAAQAQAAAGPGVPQQAAAQHENGDRVAQCTAPQLRRFIKSRPYVPMHELRRRFSINGDDDDVTPVRLSPGWIYVGLPSHEGHLLGELLRTGEIGYELSLDPRTPIVIGVYPMRPIPRT
jgi:hypothetical protein